MSITEEMAHIAAIVAENVDEDDVIGIHINRCHGDSYVQLHRGHDIAWLNTSPPADGWQHQHASICGLRFVRCVNLETA